MKSAIILASTAALASALVQPKPAVGAQLTSAKGVDESSRGKRAPDICLETEAKVVKKEATFEEWKKACGAEGLCNAMHSEPLLWQRIPELCGWAFAQACPSSPAEPLPAPAQYGCLETEAKVVKKEVTFKEWKKACGAEGLCNAMHSQPLLWQRIPELCGWAFTQACPSSPAEPSPAPAQYGCLETEARVIKNEASFDEWKQVCKTEGLCRALHSEPLLWQKIPELPGWAFTQACPSSPTEPSPSPALSKCLETEVKVIKNEASFDEWKQVCKTEGLCRALHSEPLLWQKIPDLAGWVMAQACPSANSA